MSQPGLPMMGKQPEAKLEATYEYTPFYIEPIVAWRSWNVCAPGVCSCDGERTLIRSISKSLPWLRRKATRAHCLDRWKARHTKSTATPSFHHSAPDHSHGCGIYSVKQLGTAQKWAHFNKTRFSIIGQVQIWGKVLQYEDGYIAEYAYPLNFFVPAGYSFYMNEKGPGIGHPEISPEEIASLLEDAYYVDTQIGWERAECLV